VTACIMPGDQRLPLPLKRHGLQQHFEEESKDASRQANARVRLAHIG
jgi:hypothetical protein